MKTPILCTILCLVLFSCSQEQDDVNLFSKAELDSFSEVVSYSEIENEILDLVNEYRSNNNLSFLKTLNIISNVANGHTIYMVTTGEVSHANFGERASKLMKTTGAKKVSENVAYGYSTAQSVLNGWLNSTEHKKIIETVDFTHFGISTVRNKEGRNYFTQIFIKK